MAYVIVALSLFLLLSALTALRPGRRGILKIVAYPVGWAAGELPVQAIIIEFVLLGFQWWWGWPPEGWLESLLVAVATLVVVCNLALVAIQFYSRVVVRRAMSSAPKRPLVVAPAKDDRFSSWWRTLLQWPVHPKSMLITRHVPYGPERRQRLDVWRMSTTPKNAPVCLYVHGGAWTVGDKREQGRPMLHELVSRGWIAVAINYRLAPKDPWPAQIQDVTRALGWVKGSIREMGGDPERVVVAGGSAGGHLAALLALTADDPTWRPTDMPDVVDWSVRASIPFYGVLEMTGDEEVWRGIGHGLVDLLEDYVVQVPIDGNEDLYRAMSPMERITADAPPFLVVQGANDTLVDVNVARTFVARFRETAIAPIYYVEIPFTQHAFDVTASPRTSATTRAVVAFVNSIVGEPAELGPVSSQRG